jgi:hypothetical protein
MVAVLAAPAKECLRKGLIIGFEAMKRAGLVSLLALSCLMGCESSDESGTTASTSAEAQVRKVVTDFYTAVERKDGRRACSLMTAKIRREVKSIGRYPNSPPRTCARAMVAVFGGSPPPRVRSVEVSGNSARVVLVGGDAGLVKTEGAWKIEAF